MTISYVRSASAVSTSLTSAVRSTGSAVSSSVFRLAADATGASLTGSIVIETVAGAESTVPSSATYANESGPL